MNTSIPSCPLCGETQNSPFDRRKFRGEVVTNCLCSNCGLVYQSPRRSEAELEAFYEREYRQLYQGSEGPTHKDLAVQNGRAEALLGFAGDRLAGLSRHLDIGCSAGVLLQGFQRAYNCQPVGVEPGRAYREYAQGQGLEVYPSLDELRAGRQPGFDLISLAHVLEHLPDPVEYLAALRADLLLPEGWLLVEVPNLYAHDSFEIAHLVSYSPYTLSQALQKAGYEIVASQQHGRPRSRLIPLYLTVLAHPASGPASFHLRPESKVGLKRKAGMLHRRLLTRLFPRQAWVSFSD
jgi:2-polyprenyl-3-methyl-5-hydroxy-6-metoxy-1,4-benzoquinol methylase